MGKRYITHNGRTLSMAQWALEVGVSTVALRLRLARRGVQEALTVPVKQMPAGATLDDVAAELGVTRERARQIEASAKERVRIAMAMRELIGVELTVELLTAMRRTRLCEWRASLQRMHGAALEAAKEAA